MGVKKIMGVAKKAYEKNYRRHEEEKKKVRATLLLSKMVKKFLRRLGTDPRSIILRKVKK